MLDSDNVVLGAVEWGALKDIDDTPPLDDEDKLCLKEIGAVLKKHGKLARFGVTLAHKHFDLEEGEILMEYADPENRELITRVIPSEAEKNSVETSWIFLDDGVEVSQRCQKGCYKSGAPNGAHVLQHY